MERPVDAREGANLGGEIGLGLEENMHGYELQNWGGSPGDSWAADRRSIRSVGVKAGLFLVAEVLAEGAITAVAFLGAGLSRRRVARVREAGRAHGLLLLVSDVWVIASARGVMDANAHSAGYFTAEELGWGAGIDGSRGGR
jgi:hypothetical protein